MLKFMFENGVNYALVAVTFVWVVIFLTASIRAILETAIPIMMDKIMLRYFVYKNAEAHLPPTTDEKVVLHD